MGNMEEEGLVLEEKRFGERRVGGGRVGGLADAEVDAPERST